MPIYPYKCETCAHEFDKTRSMDDRDAPQECPKCNSTQIRRLIVSVAINFVGDGWTSKNLRVQRQMNARRSQLAQKEREAKGDGAVPSLQPNVGGQEVGSWSEAKKLAASQGKNASTYDAKIKESR